MKIMNKLRDWYYFFTNYSVAISLIRDKKAVLVKTYHDKSKTYSEQDLLVMTVLIQALIGSATRAKERHLACREEGCGVYGFSNELIGAINEFVEKSKLVKKNVVGGKK